jgi:hypothetical protein
MSTKDSMTETAARIGRIVRMDVALDRLVPALSEVERVVERCIFTEGPSGVRMARSGSAT